MGLSRSCCDEKIVHIFQYIGTTNAEFIMDRLEQVIDHCLEHGWGVCESKVHDIRLKKAIFCFECCLVLISIFDMDVVVPPSDIKLSKDPGVFYLSN